MQNKFHIYSSKYLLLPLWRNCASKTNRGKVAPVVFTQKVNAIFHCIYVSALENSIWQNFGNSLMRRIICVVRMEVKERYNKQPVL